MVVLYMHQLLEVSQKQTLEEFVDNAEKGHMVTVSLCLTSAAIPKIGHLDIEFNSKLYLLLSRFI